MQAATFDLGAPIQCLFFSENGTWLAAVAADQSSSISIWDLRKSTEIKSLETGSPIDAIDWDYTGQFLAAAGSGGITVLQYSKSSKEWSEALKSATPARRIAWGRAAHSIVTIDREGIVRILSNTA